MSRKAKKKRAASKAAVENRPPSSTGDAVAQWVDNLLFALTLLILFMRPFVSGRTYPQYNHFFHIGVGVITILWLIKSWRRERLDLHNRLITGFLFAFLAVCSITFFTTVNKGITLRYIHELLCYTLLCLVIANNFRDATSLRTAVAAMLGSALLVNIYGLYQRYHTLELTRRHIESVMKSGNQDMLMGIPLGTGILYRLESVRVFSTFIYPNAYAIFLGFNIALAIGLVLSTHEGMRQLLRSSIAFISGRAGTNTQKPEKEGSRVWNILKGIGGMPLIVLFAVSCVLIPWNLWLTYSRGGWVSMLVILLVFPVMLLRKKNPSGASAAALILVAVLLLGTLMPATAISSEELPVREVSVLGRLKEFITVTHRLSYWKAALVMVRDHPWFGIGWGAFEKAYPRYMILGGYPVKLAHNNYLQVWAETGTIGLNSFVGLWLVFLYTFWRKTASQAVGKLRWLACGFGAATIGFLVHSLVDFDLYLPALAYLVFAMVGLLVAVPAESDERDKFSVKFPPWAAATCILFVCVFIVFLFRSYLGLNLRLGVEKDMNRAFPTQFAIEQGFKADPVEQQRTLRESIPRLEKSIDYFPLDSETQHMLGDNYLRLAHIERNSTLFSSAIKELERAVELNPLSPYVFQSLASAYWATGNVLRQPDMFEQALQAELRASENFPVSPVYHERLKQIYTSLGMGEQAEEQARLAAELKKHYKEF